MKYADEIEENGFTVGTCGLVIKMQEFLSTERGDVVGASSYQWRVQDLRKGFSNFVRGHLRCLAVSPSIHTLATRLIALILWCGSRKLQPLNVIVVLMFQSFCGPCLHIAKSAIGNSTYLHVATWTWCQSDHQSLFSHLYTKKLSNHGSYLTHFHIATSVTYF